MSSRYEVLLRRPGGINKTVIIDDCRSEQEARETANAMYGMEVLRVIWKGSNNSNNSTTTNSTSTWSTNSEGGSGLALLGLIGIVLIGGVVMLIVQYWWIFLGISSVLGGLIWLGRDKL